ncbi:unnamed protein product [Heterobilharzia americana]|nr:unnamed protein product [Heterobilharzia americana]
MSQYTREVKELYKNGKYQECLEKTEEILRTSKDYATLVMKGACCSHLGYHEDSVESYFAALSMDSENNLAWIGIYNELKKNSDKNGDVLLRVCARLIEKFSVLDSSEKYLDYTKTFIKTVVQSRLPLPLGCSTFNDMCEFVLEMDPCNLYALEASFRLEIEFFFFCGFPELLDPSLSSQPMFINLIQRFNPFINSSSLFLKRLTRFEQSLETMQESISLSKTFNITLCLSHLLLKLYTHFLPNFMPTTDYNNCNNISKSGNPIPEDADLRNYIKNEIDKLDFDGVIGFNNWIKHDVIDIHAGLFYGLALFKLYQFNECSSVIRKLIYDIDRNCKQFNAESARFIEPVSKFIEKSRGSNATMNVSSKHSLCTPFRLNIHKFFVCVQTACDVYTFIKYWLNIIFMANTCNLRTSAITIEETGTLPCCTGNTDFIPSNWKDVYLTLSMEYYLVLNNVKNAFHIYEQWKILHGYHYKSTTDTMDLSPRFLICLVWLKAILSLKSSEFKTEEITPHSVKDGLLNILKTSNTILSSRYQYLVGCVMEFFAQSFPDCSSTMGCEEQLAKFSLGVQYAKHYYANHLQMGHIYREMERSKEALTSYTEAYNSMPNLPICAYNYAVALCRQDEWEKALDVYSSINQSEFTKEMWLNYGLIALRLGRIYECLPALQRVVLAKNEALYWEILGEAYLLRRSHETAVRAFNRALELEPNRPFTLILCGRTYRHMNEIYSALSCFNNALSMIENSYMTDPMCRKFYILILKELIEIHMTKCRSGIYQGYTGQAINDLQLLGYFIGSKVVPFWFFRYTGDVLSLLSVVDDLFLLIEIPTRMVSLMENVEISTDSKISNDTVKINIVTCLQLANIYFACALRTRSSSVRYPAASLDPNAGVSTSETESEHHPSRLLVIGSLLVSLGVHQLNQGYYIQRNIEMKQQLSNSPHVIKYNGFSSSELYRLSESTLKQAIQLLDSLSNIYKDFLSELLKDKSLLAPGVTTLDDEIDETDTRDRLILIGRLQSRAWSALAGIYSTSEENFDSEITYCLCQALLLNPDNTTVMVNLAMQQMKQGQTELAVNLVAQAKAVDPDNFKVWLVSAQLAAVMSGGPSIGPGLLVNTEVLSHLIHAGFTGSNYRVASQLTLHLIPIIIEYAQYNFLCDPSTTTSSSISMSQQDSSALIQMFDKRAHLRLSINVAIECLNRAIAFEPGNIRLWHNRGILLQLMGFSVPAKQCLKKAVSLLNKQKGLCYQDNPDELAFRSLVLSHYFLITYICGSPDWQVGNQLVTLTKNPNSTFCHSLAEACAKGIIYTMCPDRPSLPNLSMICLTKEIERLQNQGSYVTKSAMEFQPNAGIWLMMTIQLLDCSYFGPVQEMNKLQSYLTELKLNALSLSSSSSLLYRSISFPLAYNLSQIGVRLGKDVNWLTNSPLCKMIYEISSSKQMEYESLSNLPDLYSNRLGDNYLPLGGQLTDTELNNWIMNNAYLSLCSSRLTSTLACISRYLVQRPSEPMRWIYLFACLLDRNQLSQTTNLSSIQLKSNITSMNDKLIIYTNIIMKCLSVITELNTECPMNLVFASALVNFTSWWLDVDKYHSISKQVENVYENLLLNLRRAAVLFPNTPNILSTLRNISETIHT